MTSDHSIQNTGFLANYSRSCVRWDKEADCVLITRIITIHKVMIGAAVLEDQFDFVSVHNVYRFEEGSRLGQWSNLPPSVKSTSSRLLVAIRTDGPVARKGFSANYNTRNMTCTIKYDHPALTITSPGFPFGYPDKLNMAWQISQPEGCTIHLQFKVFKYDHPALTITSPGFPFGYPDKLNMTWHISQPEGCTIHVQFEIFKLERLRDFLFVYDGQHKSDALLGKWTGDQLPSPIVSTCNNLRTDMITDGALQRHGFAAKYHSSCVVRLQFEYFELESNNDFVHVYDGPASRENLLDTWTGKRLPPPRISTDNELTVVMRTDSEGTRTSICTTSFSNPTKSIASPNYPQKYDAYLSYTWIISRPQDCVVRLQFEDFEVVSRISEETRRSNCTTSFSNPTNSIASPNYPQKYDAHLSYTWIISRPQGCVVRLQFEYFELESDNDFVHVYDGPASRENLLDTWTGKRLPPPRISTGNELTVVMRTDRSVEFRGFYATYDT
ncbi:CUB domain protein, partial [Opisthorchis viverrini]